MLKRSKILIVEDETDLQKLMEIHLNREGYETFSAGSAEEALPLIETQKFDLCIFDWMLPGVSGIKLCEMYAGKFPILLLTARAETADIVRGLSAGADDYVTKPFEIPVFLARISALLRRKTWEKINQPLSLLKMGGTVLDAAAHKCLKEGNEVHLTPMEFKLLSLLIENSGRVLSREKLVNYLQDGDATVVDRTIDQHIFSLRKKLSQDADHIETIRGVGYRVTNCEN